MVQLDARPAADAILAQTVTLVGHDDDEITAYTAAPLDPALRGAVVVVHHMPGYDDASKEIARTLAARGYLAICPNLHHRDAPGASPDDASAASRAKGGVPDDRFVGDVQASVEWLRAQPNANGKVGVIGYCSGGRQAFLAACRLPFDAAVDCYGAFVVGTPPADYSLKVTPLLDEADNLTCPLLGLFGEEDQRPSPQEVAELDADLERRGKPHEFHVYRGAGHAFFATDRPSYRPAAAVDGWERILTFFGTYLSA